MHHCATGPLGLCASRRLCLSAPVPLCLCDSKPLWLYAFVHQCICAFVPTCLCVSGLLFLRVSMPLPEIIYNDRISYNILWSNKMEFASVPLGLSAYVHVCLCASLSHLCLYTSLPLWLYASRPCDSVHLCLCAFVSVCFPALLPVCLCLYSSA